MITSTENIQNTQFKAERWIGRWIYFTQMKAQRLTEMVNDMNIIEFTYIRSDSGDELIDILGSGHARE